MSSRRGSDRKSHGKRMVEIHYLRPPDRTEIFRQELLHEDDAVKVTLARDVRLARPLLVRDRVILETGSPAVWFTFPGAWHDIGRFHLADGTFTGIYANLLVPCVFEPGGVWRTTDLFLDLWLPAEPIAGVEGRRPTVLDEDELSEAEALGWIEPAAAHRAREEAARLLREAESGRWPPPVVEEWTLERALANVS